MRLRLLALPVVAMMLMTLPAFAQTTTGRLIGKVVDERRGALPGCNRHPQLTGVDRRRPDQDQPTAPASSAF